ncbi:uncharacterized protein BO80DRAFT_162197 [Aspergillus ibericus CBS 121593]|uniref:Uncharacterized protein n=1 Tax=Aspergillus ibericus CBS 121593 TaxID=1448316 RepID=A0A395GT86_9EURO|nr:hypothetical protein BO80DRAFT_162197 [Aspergillus ibericus CBS 121593]RAK98394.1 hypothetical protein BO80DRAFT_162197 [Aspergillus ibericus CBS 121593]
MSLGDGVCVSPRTQARSHTNILLHAGEPLLGTCPKRQERGRRRQRISSKSAGGPSKRISIHPARTGCSTPVQGLGRSLIWVFLAGNPGSGTAGYPFQGSILYRRPKDGRTAFGAMPVGWPGSRAGASPTSAQINIVRPLEAGDVDDYLPLICSCIAA